MFKLISGGSYPNYSFNIILSDSVIFRGAVLYESDTLECFKPWQAANNLAEKLGLNLDNASYKKLSENCACLTLDNGQELVFRFNCKLIELFDCSGNLIESNNY